MKEKKKRRIPALSAVLLCLGPAFLLLSMGGCSVSEDMVLLPKPKGLVPLTQLEQHLDYKDPFDSRTSYVVRPGGGR